MKRKPHSTSLVLLLVCIFTFWWGISVLAQHDTMQTVAVTASVPAAATVTPTVAPLVVSETITNNTHTYSGVFIPASACDSFGSGIHYSADNGGAVSIVLLTTPSTTACAQAAGTTSGQPFSVSIKLGAKETPQFEGVFLNGTQIPAQLVTGN